MTSINYVGLCWYQQCRSMLVFLARLSGAVPADPPVTGVQVLGCKQACVYFRSEADAVTGSVGVA